jgi:hypothetical protein
MTPSLIAQAVFDEAGETFLPDVTWNGVAAYAHTQNPGPVVMESIDRMRNFITPETALKELIARQSLPFSASKGEKSLIKIFS